MECRRSYTLTVVAILQPSGRRGNDRCLATISATKDHIIRALMSESMQVDFQVQEVSTYYYWHVFSAPVIRCMNELILGDDYSRRQISVKFFDVG